MTKSNTLKWIVTCSSLCLQISCTKITPSDSDLSLPIEPNNFQFEELTSSEVQLKNELKQLSLNDLKAFRANDSKCLKFYKDHVLPRKSETSTSNNQYFVSTGIQELNQISPDHCNHPHTKMLMAESLKYILTQHHHQIILLIGSSYSTNDLYTIEKAIIAAAKSNVNPAEFQTLHLKSSPEANQKLIIDSISKRLPTFFVILGKDSDLNIPLEISKRYLIPSIVLSPNENSHLSYPYAFRVYPSQETMSKHLVDYLATKGIKRVGMLRSLQSHQSRFFNSIVNFSKTKDIEIVSTENFDRNQSSTMQKASEILFKTDPNLRPDEYASLVEAKQNSQEEALTEIELGRLRLEPQVDFEAVLISDHFRIARFFANQFKFLGAPKITLIGSHEWRDPGLVDPPDHQLNGSLFADFIGRKSSIPENLHDFIEEENGFLFSKDSKINLDTLILSYTALWISNEVVSSDLSKQQILKKLKELKANFPGFIQQKIFDTNRAINWPTYIFSIAGKDIVEVAQFNSPIQTQNTTK